MWCCWVGECSTATVLHLHSMRHERTDTATKKGKDKPEDAGEMRTASHIVTSHANFYLILREKCASTFGNIRKNNCVCMQCFLFVTAIPN